MVAICQLCTSPYRKEVLKAYKNRVKSREIFEKYKGLMGYTSNEVSFYQMVRRHLKNGHNVTAIIVPEELKKPANLENLVARMTELAVVKVENMDPSQVKLNEVFQGHRVLLESKKLQLTEDAMMIALTKMFGPTIMGEEITEGEITQEQVLEGREGRERGKDELLNAGPAQDGGAEQKSP
jgi:hypothetical protein